MNEKLVVVTVTSKHTAAAADGCGSTADPTRDATVDQKESDS
jgi:hypothetical protein